MSHSITFDGSAASTRITVPPVRRDHGVRATSARVEEQVEAQREEHRQGRSDDHLRVVLAAVAVEDQPAETAELDDGRDADEPDRGHGGDADPGHDDRQRERQLHGEQATEPGHADPVGGVGDAAAGTPSMPATMFRTSTSSV